MMQTIMAGLCKVRIWKENQVEEEAPATEPEEPAVEDVSEETSVEDVAEEQEVVVERQIEEFYGIDGISISYTGYELKDTYPDASGDDLVFSMNASAGCKLVVLNF